MLLSCSKEIVVLNSVVLEIIVSFLKLNRTQYITLFHITLFHMFYASVS